MFWRRIAGWFRGLLAAFGLRAAPSESAGVRLTAESAGEVRRIIFEQELPASVVVRIDLKRINGQFHYTMGMEHEFDAQADWCEECYGIRVVCPRSTLPLLGGTVIRFDPERRGFLFDNPNAVH